MRQWEREDINVREEGAVEEEDGVEKTTNRQTGRGSEQTTQMIRLSKVMLSSCSAKVHMLDTSNEVIQDELNYATKKETFQKEDCVLDCSHIHEPIVAQSSARCSQGMNGLEMTVTLPELLI